MDTESAPAAETPTPKVSSPPASTLVEQLKVQIRPVTEEDVGFIKKNWLRIVRHSVDDLCPSDLFYEEHDKVIGMLSNKSECLVACDPEYPFYIYGFIVGSPLPDSAVLVHFVFTRDEWRRRGVARHLVSQLGYKPGAKIVATQLTTFLKKSKLRALKVIYNQYVLWSLWAI